MESKIRLAPAELALNYPLYAATCLNIAVPQHGIVPLFPMTTAQMKTERAIRHARKHGRPPRIVTLKARQTGISTDAEGRLFQMAHLGPPGSSGIVIAHKRDSARKIFGMARRFYRLLPEPVQLKKRHFASGLIEFEQNDSSLQVEVATEGGGRGYTAMGVHLSEFAQYPNAGATLEAVVGAVPPVFNSLIIVESTPFGMNDFHDLYVRAKEPDNAFTAIFVPWFEEKRYVMPAPVPWPLDDEEQELHRKYGCTYEQLAWRRFKIDEYKGDKERFRQEMPSDDRSCFLISGRPVFDPESVEYYAHMVPPYVEEDTLPPRGDIFLRDGQPVIETFPGGPLRIYKEPVGRHLYVPGVDCSEGDPGSDPSPIVVIDRMTLEVVAVWWGRIRPDLLAHKAAALCMYYNKARCIWEANNHGIAFGLEFQKIYHDYYSRPTTLDSTAQKVTDKAGFFTSEVTRGYLFNVVRRYVNDRMGICRDPQIVAEMSWLRYDERNRPQAPAGKTKDCIVALALALEEHRGGGDNDLAPLAIDQRDMIAVEMHRVRVARSMGIEAEPDIARFDITADELERIDEMAHLEDRRREKIGLSRQN